MRFRDDLGLFFLTYFALYTPSIMKTRKVYQKGDKIMAIKINAKVIREMAQHEPVETFIGLAISKIDVESCIKEYGDVFTAIMIRRLVWYYKLRASGMAHELAYLMSNSMLFTEKVYGKFKEV